jgi:ubiquinone biosynthesis protein COQ9
MKMKAKLALFALAAGATAFLNGSCFWRWAGDTAADILWFRGID